jgi:hypothetical protein
MPQFENLDQYEVSHPESGRRKIIPIAPHSMQTVDYRPKKREQPQGRPPKPKPAFADIAVEPISVRQMEKEFRQASRTEARRNPNKGFSGWMRALRSFFQSLLKSKPKERPARADRKRSGDRRKPAGRRANKPPQQGGGKPEAQPNNGPGGKRRRRRSRPPRDRQDGGQPPAGKSQPGPREGGRARNPGQPGNSGGKPSGGGRSRRKRRPSGNGPSGQGPGNPNANQPD